MKKLTKTAAKQVVASQTKVAFEALRQMQAAEAAGDIEAAVVAAKKLMDATHAAASVASVYYPDGTECRYAEKEYAAMMEGLGCTVGKKDKLGLLQQDVIYFYKLPISDAVFKAYRAQNEKK
jgi:hypothetical protein